MKTTRNQKKYPYFYDCQCFYRRELRTVGIQFLMRLQKEQQKENKQKNQLKLARKRLRIRKAILWPSKYV